jgi:hypothetical protein
VPSLLRLIADHLEVLGTDLIVRDITFRVIDTADDPGIGEMTVYYDRDGLNHDGDPLSDDLDLAWTLNASGRARLRAVGGPIAEPRARGLRRASNSGLGRCADLRRLRRPDFCGDR